MNKQLFEKQSNSYKPIYPLVRLEDIVDTISDKSIQWILNNYNHIYVEYSESVAVTRNKVPQLLRRTGLWISYNAGTEVITEYYKGDNKDVTNFIKWTNDDNWERFDKIKHLDGSITYQHLSESLRQLIGQGNNITNFPDDEDLEVKDGLLKFKDRDFEPNNFSGLGRVILRKNIKAVDGQPKNVLTQDMINKENTIYEIRYDFDLNGAEITIPEGCVLDFQGGSLNNGIIVGNNTSIFKTFSKIFNLNIDLTGSWSIEGIYPEWFENIVKDKDCYNSFQKAATIGRNMSIPCRLLAKTYTISKTIEGVSCLIGVDRPQYPISKIYMTGKGPNIQVHGWGKIQNLSFERTYNIATDEDLQIDKDAAIKNCFIFLGQYDGAKATSYQLDSLFFSGVYYNGITCISESDLTTITNVTANSSALNVGIYLENRRIGGSNAPSASMKLRRLFMSGSIPSGYDIGKYSNVGIFISGGETVTIEDSILNGWKNAVFTQKTNSVNIHNIHCELMSSLYTNIIPYDNANGSTYNKGQYLTSSVTDNFVYRVENSGSIPANYLENLKSLPTAEMETKSINGVTLTCLGRFVWYRIYGYEPCFCTIKDCVTWGSVSFAQFASYYTAILEGIRCVGNYSDCAVLDSSNQTADPKIIKIINSTIRGNLKSTKDESFVYYVENSSINIDGKATEYSRIYSNKYGDRLRGFNTTNGNVKGKYKIVTEDITITGDEDEDTYFVKGTSNITITFPRNYYSFKSIGKKITILKLDDGGLLNIVCDRYDSKIPFTYKTLSNRGESITLMNVFKVEENTYCSWVCIYANILDSNGKSSGLLTPTQYKMSNYNYTPSSGSLIHVASILAPCNGTVLNIIAGKSGNISGSFTAYIGIRSSSDSSIVVKQNNAAQYVTPKFYYNIENNYINFYVAAPLVGGNIAITTDYSKVSLKNESSDKDVSTLNEISITE